MCVGLSLTSMKVKFVKRLRWEKSLSGAHRTKTHKCPRFNGELYSVGFICSFSKHMPWPALYPGLNAGGREEKYGPLYWVLCDWWWCRK